jgi:hypothetical protein
VVSQTEIEFVYRKLNIFRTTGVLSGVQKGTFISVLLTVYYQCEIYWVFLFKNSIYVCETTLWYSPKLFKDGGEGSRWTIFNRVIKEFKVYVSQMIAQVNGTRIFLWLTRPSSGVEWKRALNIIKLNTCKRGMSL